MSRPVFPPSLRQTGPQVEATLYGPRKALIMKYDEEKIDDTVLALLFLTSFSDRGIVRAWKGQSWDVMHRLYAKGLISDPQSKAKSVIMNDEGAKRSEELFDEMFGRAV